MNEGQKEILKGLYNRRSLCKFSIHVLDTQAAEDPRQPEAIEFYKQQLADIDAQIAEIEGKPPPVIVKVKTAKLFSKVEAIHGGRQRLHNDTLKRRTPTTSS